MDGTGWMGSWNWLTTRAPLGGANKCGRCDYTSSQAGHLISYLHLLDFSPLCVFTCVIRSPAWQDAKSHWLHLFDLSQLCIFKCLLQSPACEDTKSHWLHLKTYRDIVAFARLFSIVHFQIAQQRGCITTLVAVVWFFSTVHKQTNVTIGFAFPYQKQNLRSNNVLVPKDPKNSNIKEIKILRKGNCSK